MKTKTTLTRRVLALCMSVLMLMTAWVFVAPTKAAAEPDIDVWQGGWSYNGFSNNHISSADGFAQFINNVGTGTSYSGQTIYRTQHSPFTTYNHSHLNRGLSFSTFPDTSGVYNPLDRY